MKTYKLLIAALSVLFITACSKSKLYEYPSNTSKDAGISNFSVLNAAGQSVATNVELDKDAGRIFVTVAAGTDVTRLVPRATVSEGVIVKPGMGVYTDFSKAITYTLIAGDRTTTKEWTIVVSE